MKNRAFEPHHSGRCQAMETRLVDVRSRSPHYLAVQCSLPRHGPDREHEWMGRPFGSPGAAKRVSRKPGRCANTEVRELDGRRYKEKVKLQEVRCSRPAGHEGTCAWMGRSFGTPPKRRSRGSSNWVRWNERRRAAQVGSAAREGG